MQKLSCYLPLIAITLVGCSSSNVSPAAAPAAATISADELNELVESGAEFVFLDVREPKELEKFGTLYKHINIPIGQLEARISEIPRGVPIVVACNVGPRAERGAALLLRHGYQDVRSMSLTEYKNRGYQLIHPRASP